MAGLFQRLLFQSFQNQKLQLTLMNCRLTKMIRYWAQFYLEIKLKLPDDLLSMEFTIWRMKLRPKDGSSQNKTRITNKRSSSNWPKLIQMLTSSILTNWVVPLIYLRRRKYKNKRTGNSLHLSYRRLCWFNVMRK